MRIITGQFKGRHFDIPRTFKARPTTDFAKENLFNVLNRYVDFYGATALDLFSGTGSISLELVSRGCSSVVSIEQDRDHHRFICNCLQKLGTTACTALRADAFRYLRRCNRKFDFVFADPPYAMKELDTLPALVMDSGIVADGGLFVLEHGKDYDFSANTHFVDHRTYGSVNFSLFKP